MYLYLYDSALKGRPYTQVVNNLETKLTDLGVTGKIVRLTSLLSPRQVIQDELRRGKDLKTIVVVGDDTTFTKIIQHVADLPVTFGWVPVGPKTDMAERFGLPYGAACAQILSRRRIMLVDVGQFNQYFFIDHVVVPVTNITMNIDNAITISGAQEKMMCSIWNLPATSKSDMPPGYTPIPHDRQLEIVLQPVAKKSFFNSSLAPASIFPFKEVKLKLEKTMPIDVDGHVMKENQITIKLVPLPLKLIVGKSL